MKKRKKIKLNKKRTLTLLIVLIIISGLAVGIKILVDSKSQLTKITPTSIAADKTKNISDKTTLKQPVVEKEKDQPVKTTNTSINNISYLKVKQPMEKYIEFYKNDVFFGDSVTEGFSAYDFLNDSNAIGIKGLTTVKALNEISKFKDLKPTNIYILLGNNDLDMGVTAEKFVYNYTQLVLSIKEQLPNSKICVQSILSVTEKAEQKDVLMSNKRISEFNTALKIMAKEQNIKYIDIDFLIKGTGEDLREQDGIHVKPDFYYLWLNYLEKNSI